MPPVPKYEKRNVTQGAKPRPRKTAPSRAYGKVPTPSGMTGRLVEPDKKGKLGEMMSVHWCPADGVEWECRHCGEWFRRDEDRRDEPWRRVA